MKRIILASQSPRRRQLLGAMNVQFEVIPSKYDEQLDDSRDPELVAKELALGKAMDVAKNNPDAYVIGSDTIVTIDGHQLEKPTSPDDAHRMLKLLAGRANYVTTGVVIICLTDNVRLSGVETSVVHFGPYDEMAVNDYVATGEPMDKAGAYGIQNNKSRKLIASIEGRYDTIAGLPTHISASLLKQCGVDANELSDEAVETILWTSEPKVGDQ